MKHFDLKRSFRSKKALNFYIIIIFILLLYLLISLYFTRHFFFNTIINGIDFSLKAHSSTKNDILISDYINNYELNIIDINGKIEKIKAKDIEMKVNNKNEILKVGRLQKSYKWLLSLFIKQKYYMSDLYSYNNSALESKINRLNCMNNNIIKPKNVSFEYKNGSFQEVKEVYGNSIITENLYKAIRLSIAKGETKLDLDKKHCYEKPEYTVNSKKTAVTKNILNKCVSADITYKFGDKRENLSDSTIYKWLSVDENLDVVINKKSIKDYLDVLALKYDTVGISRKFKTSSGKTVEVKGGLYGWRINRAAEAEELYKNILNGEVIEKEPIYIQRALYRGDNEIGDTYVEINITKQLMWFYKDGKLKAFGAVVTGNPNRGWATVTGTYMLNYKQKNATLKGPGYESKVTYWMPFFGNIGIHDAIWRHSFGGEIYKTRGSHGCVNSPFYLAKEIFENIEEGDPIICYEE